MKTTGSQVFILSEQELDSICVELIPRIHRNRLVLLSGEMGAGKTRLVRALGEHMGFLSEVGSPSYSIINEYRLTDPKWQMDKIFHIDLYRLQSIQEALDIGIMDYITDGELCIIEWPELIEPLLSSVSIIKIQIDVLENQQRRFILTV
jgi:tRNA threonylcarbamoyladenosine biosynthesis protein TsaE